MTQVVDEFRVWLSKVADRYQGEPRRELEALLLIALEREQLVAVAYRNDLMRGRLEELEISPELAALAEQALAWAWKDEEMHTILTRGVLKRVGGTKSKIRAVGQQWSGYLGGWASSVKQHLRWSKAPVSRAIAGTIIFAGGLAGRIPKGMRKHLQYMSFGDFCRLQVEAEDTAAVCWDRIADLSAQVDVVEPAIVAEFRRIKEDEDQHRAVFALLAERFDGTPGPSDQEITKRLGGIDPFFVPRSLRIQSLQRHPIGSGGDVHVLEQNPHSSTKTEPLTAVASDFFDRVGLKDALSARVKELGRNLSEIKVLIKPSFMFGYDKRDSSTYVDPKLVLALIHWLRTLGCQRIAVAEATNLYSRFHENRDVQSVAQYLGYRGDDFEIVDLGADLIEHEYKYGMGQSLVSRDWKDADFRIAIGKMRSHPVDLAHLCVDATQGAGASFETFLFAERQAHRETALIMPLVEFPAHFAFLDAFESAGDGVLGIIACPRGPKPRRLYAGVDALSIDLVAARHMGIDNSRRSAVLDAACYWFGDPSLQTDVKGTDTSLADWHSPLRNGWTTLLSRLAYPVFQHASGRGALFLPYFDEDAFPPLRRLGLFKRGWRGLIRRVVGLKKP